MKRYPVVQYLELLRAGELEPPRKPSEVAAAPACWHLNYSRAQIVEKLACGDHLNRKETVQ